MNTGPPSIFDNSDFIYIFEKCVHFIGSINLIEEQHINQKILFDDTELRVLRELCSACLASFDQLSSLELEKKPEKLRVLLLALSQHENDFKLIQQMTFESLDAEMKELVLPEMCERLRSLNYTLAQYGKQTVSTGVLHMFYHSMQNLRVNQDIFYRIQHLFVSQAAENQEEALELNTLTPKASK